MRLEKNRIHIIISSRTLVGQPSRAASIDDVYSSLIVTLYGIVIGNKTKKSYKKKMNALESIRPLLEVIIAYTL